MSAELLDSILGTLISQNMTDGKALIRVVNIMYDSINPSESWRDTKYSEHGTLSKYLRGNPHFQFIRVGPGKHLVSISEGFEFSPVDLFKLRDRSSRSVRRTPTKKRTRKRVTRTPKKAKATPVKKTPKTKVSTPAKSLTPKVKVSTPKKNVLKKVSALEKVKVGKVEEEKRVLEVKLSGANARLRERNSELNEMKIKIEEFQKNVASLEKQLEESKGRELDFQRKLAGETEEKEKFKKEVERLRQLLEGKGDVVEGLEEKVEVEKTEAESSEEVEEAKEAVVEEEKVGEEKEEIVGEGEEGEGEEGEEIILRKEYHDKKCELIYPKTVEEVKRGEINHFEIRCPEAVDVSVILDDENWYYLTQVKTEGVFEGDVKVESYSSFIDIFAKWSDTAKFLCICSIDCSTHEN